MTHAAFKKLIAPPDLRHQAFARPLAKQLPSKQIFTDPIS